MKILVIKRDKLGDLLLTTPMLAHLRAARPKAEIHLLANNYNAWVVDDDPSIDERWIYRRVRNGRRLDLGAALDYVRLSWQLRRARFDVAIVANGSPSPRAIARGVSIGAKRVIAYVEPTAHYTGLTDALPEPARIHEADRLLAMLQPLGIPMPANPIYPRYRLPRAHDDEAKRWLAKRGLAPGRYVTLGLGARRAKKQPSASQILQWAVRLKREFGLAMVFMWTPGASDNPLYPGDDETAQPVLDANAPSIHPFRGPLLPALGLVWNGCASIFPDSGLMHFAAASPGGVVGLFAQTDVSPPPSQWAPSGPHSTYLEATKSVSELSDEALFTALAPLLARR
ncbi:MAG: glycosyltransferase family 9 protein [Burkholderiales bacterium]